MILFVSSGLCVLLLLLHSLYFRPLRATIIILAFLLPLSALYGNLYDFKENILVIPIGYGIPFVQIVGFFFAFYCAITLATHIVEERDEQGRRVVRCFPLLVWTVFITVFIGIGIEYANFAIKWWTWRPGITVGKLMLIGVWGWRPLLGVPLLLQFFIDRGFHARFRYGLLMVFLLACNVTLLVLAFRAQGKSQEFLSALFILGAALFLWILLVDLKRILPAVMRHPQMRIVVPVCVVWFVFFLIWMIWVDRVPMLQYLTVPLWPLLLLLARIKNPILSIETFMFDAPRPLFGRNRRDKAL